jgi:UDP-N-acetyl-D-glucosamine dehydrogenase
VIGAAFKRDVEDARNSAAIRVMEILLSEGANVAFHDPFVKRIVLSPALYGREEGAVDLTSVPLDVERLRSSDLVAILVSHSAVDYQLILENAKLVFDAINATGGRHASPGVERL